MSPQKRSLFQVSISLFLQCGSHLGFLLYFVKKSLLFRVLLFGFYDFFVYWGFHLLFIPKLISGKKKQPTYCI